MRGASGCNGSIDREATDLLLGRLLEEVQNLRAQVKSTTVPPPTSSNNAAKSTLPVDRYECGYDIPSMSGETHVVVMLSKAQVLLEAGRFDELRCFVQRSKHFYALANDVGYVRAREMWSNYYLSSSPTFTVSQDSSYVPGTSVHQFDHAYTPSTCAQTQPNVITTAPKRRSRPDDAPSHRNSDNRKVHNDEDRGLTAPGSSAAGSSSLKKRKPNEGTGRISRPVIGREGRVDGKPECWYCKGPHTLRQCVMASEGQKEMVMKNLWKSRHADQTTKVAPLQAKDVGKDAIPAECWFCRGPHTLRACDQASEDQKCLLVKKLRESREALQAAKKATTLQGDVNEPLEHQKEPSVRVGTLQKSSSAATDVEEADALAMDAFRSEYLKIKAELEATGGGACTEVEKRSLPELPAAQACAK
ncbi:Uncharacterized protein PBTT_10379 [Plasmodiophora brassicae]|nr:hypothetical protein PBRA_008614 [Plasmodiophora brassicae]